MENNLSKKRWLHSQPGKNKGKVSWYLSIPFLGGFTVIKLRTIRHADMIFITLMTIGVYGAFCNPKFENGSTYTVFLQWVGSWSTKLFALSL